MQIIKIDLCEKYKVEACQVVGYVHEGNPELPLKPRRALVVVGGGAYYFVSDRECEPVALEFYNRGYNCFFIKYSISPSRFPAALLQVASLIDHIKKHSADYSIMPKKVFAVGFSAGGHLVGSVVAAKNNIDCLDKTLATKIEKLDCRLAGIIMSYSVINIEGHSGSYANLLGEKASELLKTKEYAFLNLDTCVKKTNAPAFIWCTADDNCVNAGSSLAYAQALNAASVTYELHIYKSGAHGLSLADQRVYSNTVHLASNIKQWLPDADQFMQSI